MKTRFPSAPGNRSAAFPLFSYLSSSPSHHGQSCSFCVEYAPNAANNAASRLFTLIITRQGRAKVERGDILFEEYDEGITRVPSSPFSSANSSKHRPYHPSLPIITDAYFIRRVIKFVAPRVWPSLNEWRINDDVKLYVAFVVDACIV